MGVATSTEATAAKPKGGGSSLSTRKTTCRRRQNELLGAWFDGVANAIAPSRRAATSLADSATVIWTPRWMAHRSSRQLSKLTIV
eukprot:2329021-Pyramimonas_sp.AAC.1